MTPLLQGPANRATLLLLFSLLVFLRDPAPARPDPGADIRGLLDVTFSTDGSALVLNRLNRGDSPLDAYRFRLFAEGKSGDHFEAFAQLMTNDAAAVYVYGAYAAYIPDPERDLRILAGKLPWIIGGYSPRAYSNKNPLVGTPLLLQYHTTLKWTQLPADAADLLKVWGTGQTPFAHSGDGGTRSIGMPVVYDNCWDVGAALQGSAYPFEYAIGFVNGTPGHPSTVEDGLSGKCFLGRVGIAPTNGVLVGVSASHGPYLTEGARNQVPFGHKLTDYNQDLVMVDATFEHGHLDVFGEAVHNTWQTPTVGNLKLNSFYLEGKYTFLGGLYAAARVEGMYFSDLSAAGGQPQSWDADRTREEFGLGYRISREALVKLVYQRNGRESLPSESPAHVADLIATQLSLKF